MNTSWWNRIYTPIIIALVFIVGMSVGKRFLADNMFVNTKSYGKLDMILDYIDEDYVDTVNIEKLEKQAILDMIEGLDPHSAYIAPEEYHSYVDPLLGNFDGIGIQFRMIRDSLTVMMPIAGGPSFEAGILAGDKIVMAGGDTIAGIGMNSNDIIKKLKGERGSLVDLEIARAHVDSLLKFTVKRDRIPTFSLDAKFMIDSSIGYIKISKFAATTIEEFDEAMAFLLNAGMEKLILDLRGNSGGYLRAAIAMSDTFLKEGKLIVYTKGKNRPEKRYFSDNHGNFEKQELIILINGNSASASEIVAGAIQDNDRGLIVGRRSFGKGLVQEQLDFRDGSAVRLTVARYYSPTGRCIQRPYLDGTEAYYADHFHKMLDDFSPKTDTIPDSLKFTTPMGKIVYGGGGIMPDVNIPLDTTLNYYLFNQLVRKSILVEFAIDYYAVNKSSLEDYIDVVDFGKQYKPSKSIYSDLIVKAMKMDLTTTDKEIENSEKIVMNAFKSELARLLFGDQAYYYIYLQDDKTFERSVELFQ